MLPSKAVKSQWPAGAQENLLPDLAKVFFLEKKHGRKNDGRSEGINLYKKAAKESRCVFFFFGMCEVYFFPNWILRFKAFFLEEHEWFLHKETPGIQVFFAP